jgi:NADH dehydrogenase [ubiquinone] 1 alpha subcomplex assembly factor 1
MITIKTTILVLGVVGVSICLGAYRASGSDGYMTDEKHAGRAHSKEMVIFDFSTVADPNEWEVEDDVVMGGRSEGEFSINDAGNAIFSGKVSLENNGGFSSVQHYFEPIDVSPYRTAFIRLKGDGKRYQFLVEAESNERHYYVYEFQTIKDWQTVEVPLAEMYAVYRGQRLTIPNYPGQTMTQVRFLIANGKPESFHLEIDKIWLK